EELADKMKAAMSVIPGLDFEFTQPIEMRFNELITGVRSDVAIKIYGEDIGVLFELANRVDALIKHVPGAADIAVEKVAGLPQMAVSYNRDKIAQYGLNIKDLNRMVRMAFAGESAGVVLEGERRFDLVVRLGENFRTDIKNLQQLYVDLPNGQQIPLAEVAAISYQTGPAKISRDDTRRRIVIGINVRNRDVESLVEEIQDILAADLVLPSGYYITYGGQFENLQNAKRRLMVAVPVALALIFVMLYFTFGSVKQALMVYTAIPLAAIGGILLLWIRGLPFSISAGVGFIALFGIAVLNGIVLIEFFNELKEKGIMNIRERVLKGTEMRLRPVLLTASAAALGFFPMAFSTSAGAEVQRPLATVVIGGLITATLLTLVVLPVLYTLFTKELETPVKPKKEHSQHMSKFPVVLLVAIGIIMSMPSNVQAQNRTIDLEQAINLAWEHNLGLRASELKIEQYKKLEKTSFDMGRTSVYYSFDENNLTEEGNQLDVYGAQQTVSFPGVYANQKKLQQQNTKLRETEYEISKTHVVREISKAYYEVLYRYNRHRQLTYLDSLYSGFAAAANRRFELGESDYLEKITAHARHQELSTQKQQAFLDIEVGYQRLGGLMQLEERFEIVYQDLPKLQSPVYNLEEQVSKNPGVQLHEQITQVAEAQTKVEKSKLWPDLKAEYFLGRDRGENESNFNGYQFGLGIPLIRTAQKGKVQAARIEHDIRQKEAENFRLSLASRYEQLKALRQKYEEAVDYYQSSGLSMAEEIIQMAKKSYLSGETGYLQYIQSLESAEQINLSYLDNLNLYNQTVLEIQYLINP
ncbi:MAG: efflux RND transporter permease subunit, partial [Cyclobacteriaceae bacterium]|nr:efflux RND transporter permease subunit [Cyclobacteriaceae bacterium]